MMRMICCVVACLGLAACGEGEDEGEGWNGGGGGTFVEPAPGSGGSASRGQALYASLCATCHGQRGGNLRGRSGIAGVVRRGTDGMPPFPNLSGGDISDIEDYLNGRGGSPATGSAAPAGSGASAGAGWEEDD